MQIVGVALELGPELPGAAVPAVRTPVAACRVEGRSRGIHGQPVCLCHRQARPPAHLDLRRNKHVYGPRGLSPRPRQQRVNLPRLDAVVPAGQQHRVGEQTHAEDLTVVQLMHHHRRGLVSGLRRLPVGCVKQRVHLPDVRLARRACRQQVLAAGQEQRRKESLAAIHSFPTSR